jgi:hypothetical protein
LTKKRKRKAAKKPNKTRALPKIKTDYSALILGVLFLAIVLNNYV